MQKDTRSSEDDTTTIYAAWEAGSLLVDRLGEGILVDLPSLPLRKQTKLGFNILQVV